MSDKSCEVFRENVRALLLKRQEDLYFNDFIELLEHEYIIMASDECINEESVGYILAKNTAHFLVDRYHNLIKVKRALIKKRHSVLFNAFTSRCEIIDSMLVMIMSILCGDILSHEIDIDMGGGVRRRVSARQRRYFAESDAAFFALPFMLHSYEKRYRDFVELFIWNSDKIAKLLRDLQGEHSKLDNGCHIDSVEIISKHFSIVMSEMAFLSEAISSLLLENEGRYVEGDNDKSEEFYKIKGVKKQKKSSSGQDVNARLIKVLHSLAFSREFFGSLIANTTKNTNQILSGVDKIKSSIQNKHKSFDKIFDIDITSNNVMIDNTKL